MAVGGNLTAMYTSLNSGSASGGPGVVVGGTANLISGSLNGGLVYGAGYAGSAQFTVNGGASQGQPIDFLSAATEYQARAAFYASSYTSANLGTVTYLWGGTTLAGTNQNYNVFNVDASTLLNSNSLTINAPAGSTVVVNVSGTSAGMRYMGITLNGVDSTRVLYNFYQATSLGFTGVGVQGTVLAPLATLNGSGGGVAGSVIVYAANATSGFGYTSNPFAGALPTYSAPVHNDPVSGVPEPGAWMLMAAGVAACAVGQYRRTR
jgi:choice-of-anchor A domain-containing protein